MSEQNGISTMGWVGIIGGGILALTVVPRLLGGLFGGGEEEGEEQGGGMFGLGNLLMLAVAGVAGWFGYQHFFGKKDFEELQPDALVGNADRNGLDADIAAGATGTAIDAQTVYIGAVNSLRDQLAAAGTNDITTLRDALHEALETLDNGSATVEQRIQADAVRDFAAQVVPNATSVDEAAIANGLTTV